MKTKLRPRLIYAPCILIGAIVSFMAGFFVGHVATFATWTLTWQHFFIYVLNSLPSKFTTNTGYHSGNS